MSAVPYPTIITSARTVPNAQPLLEPLSQRIAIIGDAPDEHAEQHGIPFVGPAGNFLDTVLRSVNIERSRCFMGYVSGSRPSGNDLARLPWESNPIQSGLAALRTDLAVFNPNICVLLGPAALRAANGGATGRKLSDWRGSLFLSTSLGSPNTKVIASYDPAGVLGTKRGCGYGFECFPLLKFDLQRAANESHTPTLTLPQRELITSWPAADLCYLLDNWPAGQHCSLDIEGGLSGWPCVSICATPTKSITIAWARLSEDEHLLVLRSFARLMGRTDVPKVLQNSLYDNFVLSYGFGIPIRNVAEDTMLKGWEVFCELAKGLSSQASIWTKEPYWKDLNAYTLKEKQRRALAGYSADSEFENKLKLCALDSAVTLEMCNAQNGALNAVSYQHYRANVSMLNPLLYMELRGINYDKEKVQTKLTEVRAEISAVASALNAHAKTELRGAKGSLSSKRLQKALYETLGYPPQFKKEQGRKTEKLTSDVEAILNLRRKLPSDQFLAGILSHRHLEGLLETLGIQSDKDGRVRCGYNVVGTETGRLTCYGSPTGAGANLQTITKSLRGNYTADPSCDFFQCDLEGADGWTVASHCARLGDRTMLDDYIAGIKPAKVIGLLYYFGPQINTFERSALKWLCDHVFPVVLKDLGKWLYDAGKVVQHGSNYGMGIPTMLINLMKGSYKHSGEPVYVEHAVGSVLQRLYFQRYPGVPLWHRWSESKLVADGTLTSASGQTRTFFGRRFGTNIKDTVKEFLAHEPQSNTTWSTNLAMLKLWNDPENRRGGKVLEAYDTWVAGFTKGIGSLIIEPLHQVHDALCGQWPQSYRAWARAKVRSYFDNELTIAGTTLVIPFDGAYGPSWGEQPFKL